jgi:hypothetical protein
VSAIELERERKRAELVARAAADREAFGKYVDVFQSIETGIAQFGTVRAELPSAAVGAGLGLSALMLALPSGHASVLKAGIALFKFAGSVRRMFTGR